VARQDSEVSQRDFLPALTLEGGDRFAEQLLDRPVCHLSRPAKGLVLGIGNCEAEGSHALRIHQGRRPGRL
jgi:hypothetical protein